MFQYLILYVFEQNKKRNRIALHRLQIYKVFFFFFHLKKNKQNTGVSFSSFYPILVLNQHLNFFFHCFEKKKRRLTINNNISSLNKKQTMVWEINLKLVSIKLTKGPNVNFSFCLFRQTSSSLEIEIHKCFNSLIIIRWKDIGVGGVDLRYTNTKKEWVFIVF